MNKRAAISQLRYWLKVISLGMVLGLGVKYVQAWVEPSGSAPLGGVYGPITSTNQTQKKDGPLGVTGSFQVFSNDGTGRYRNLIAPKESDGGQGSDLIYSSQNDTTSQMEFRNKKDFVLGKTYGTMSGGFDSSNPPELDGTFGFGLQDRDGKYFIWSKKEGSDLNDSENLSSWYRYSQLIATDEKDSEDTNKAVLTYGYDAVKKMPQVNIGGTDDGDISSSHRMDSNMMLDVKGAIRSTAASWLNTYTPSQSDYVANMGNPKGEIVIGDQFLAAGWGNSDADNWMFLGNIKTDPDADNGRTFGIRSAGGGSTSDLVNRVGFSVDMFHSYSNSVFQGPVMIGNTWDPYLNNYTDDNGNLPPYPNRTQGVKLEVTNGAIDARGGLIIETRPDDPDNTVSETNPGLVPGRMWLIQ